jgi:hypothetical protein
MSPPSITTSTTVPPARKLSARRGSVTASDPWGTHSELNLNPDRTSSSTLTIVRLVPPQLSDNPSSPPIQRRYSGHRRIGSHPSSNASAVDSIGAPRLSFAFSSFSSTQAGGGPARPASPTSPHIRPSSPGQRQSSFNKPRLSPDQLLELARQPTNPQFLSHNESHSASHSPVLQPSVLAHPTPATFTPLPPSVYLPFIDRPSEVASLISSPPSAKLFSLLAQTFPLNNVSTSTDTNFSTDPATWSFTQLTIWLTQVDREIAPDVLWVRQIRRCILPHSELIWERVKGALGIPPDLDLDAIPSSDDDVFEGESDGSGFGFPEKTASGALGGGMWYDWDAVENSPVAECSSPVHYTTTSNTDNKDRLIIAPLLAPLSSQNQQSTSSSLPPLSLPSALAQDAGLQEISEDAEEEEENVYISSVNSDVAGVKRVDPQPLIHGLRITTVPFSASPLHSPITQLRSPHSDLTFTRYSDTSSSALSSRSGSFSSLSSFVGRRSASFGGRALWSGERRPERHASEGVHRPDVERGTGNPLFPSSFARLGDRSVVSFTFICCGC